MKEAPGMKQHYLSNWILRWRDNTPTASTLKRAAYSLAVAACCWGCSGSNDDFIIPIGAPSSPQYQSIQSFGDSLAAVQSGVKWGFINANGTMVIPARYDAVKPFSGGYAAVRENGKWLVIDVNGVTVQPPEWLAKLESFSDGLAPSKKSLFSTWGFVDKTGRTVISGYDKVDRFSGGLAPVKLNGKWSYISSTGAVAFTTPYYRAYPFTDDGLALVRVAQNGTYGYIDKNGTLKIPAVYSDAGQFSGGLAPARKDSKWGYIGTDGNFVIAPAFQYAAPFNNGVALVRYNDAYKFIGKDGNSIISGNFVIAEDFSNGISKVGDGNSFWYIDSTGTPLSIGRAGKPVGDSSDCSNVQSVSTSYVGGFVHFRIMNLTNIQWNIATNNESASWAPPAPVEPPYYMLPGSPGFIDANSSASFMLKYPSLSNNRNYSTGNYNLFSLNFTGGDSTGNYTIKLTNSNNYTSPPPPTTAPWWGFLGGFVDIIEGVATMAEDPFWGIKDIIQGTYDMVSGAADNQGRNNISAQSYNTLSTAMAATLNGAQLNPLNGSYCGGDNYTISDGQNYVIELSTAKSTLPAPEVHVYIIPYNTYWARNAVKRLNDVRLGNSGAPKLSGPPYSCIFSIAFADQADTGNSSTCINGAYNYWNTAKSMSTNNIMQWAWLTNNLSTEAMNPANIKAALQGFKGYCGNIDPSCPALAITPVTVSGSPSTAGQCSWSVTAYNPAAALSASSLPAGATFSAGTCTGASTSSTPCSFTINPAPVPICAPAYITEGIFTAPLTMSCTAMSSPQTNQTGAIRSSCPTKSCSPLNPECCSLEWAFELNNTADTVRPVGTTPLQTSGSCTAPGPQQSCTLVFTSADIHSSWNIPVTDGSTTLNLNLLPSSSSAAKSSSATRRK